MIFDPVSNTEMQAARLLTGATMVGLLAAPLFRHRTQNIRIAIFVCYILGILVFAASHLR
jgi:hypothetical protein